MKETHFVRQNKEKWLQSEQLIAGETRDPEKLSTLFTQVVDDLSYSQTYYKNRSVRVYLNTIARNFFSILSNKRRDNKNHFKAYWTDELPQIVIFCRRELIISLIVFLLAATIGVLSSARDENFTAYILGNQYVEMTKENIKKGDPLGVYKDGNQLEMAWHIIRNNISVAFRTYVLGIFMSIGTLVILIYNGIMIGSFQYFFAQQDLLATSAMTIWLHGTLEISSIIIAGGAGLTLGSGLLFPGTYTRLQAFQLSAVRSLKLVMGIAPILVIAGVIESFLTRYTEVPALIKLSLIILSAVFIVGYFIVYPWRKSRVGFSHPLPETKLQANTAYTISFTKIKGQAEVLGDAFSFYKHHFTVLFRWIIASTLLGTGVFYFIYEQELQRIYTDPVTYLFQEIFFGITLDSLPKLIVSIVTTAAIVTVTTMLLWKDQHQRVTPKLSIVAFIKSALLTGVLYTLVYGLGAWGYSILLITFGTFFFIVFGFIKSDSFQKLRLITIRGWSQVMGLQVILFFTLLVFLLLLLSPLMYLYAQAIVWNVSGSEDFINKLTFLLEIFIKLLGFNLVLPLISVSFIFLYYSLQEIVFATNLKQRIGSIHTKRMQVKSL